MGSVGRRREKARNADNRERTAKNEEKEEVNTDGVMGMQDKISHMLTILIVGFPDIAGYSLLCQPGIFKRSCKCRMNGALYPALDKTVSNYKCIPRRPHISMVACAFHADQTPERDVIP
ncbi:unnamed protein product [Albugo candida]|uniref:Uncharacterized protein n=1 Tax=Albugo candida TaxID=65357 RepID=A0A024FTH8_9STRA|nr:unnamed protein product [Albugo candida]|eukprot:CCI10227.1 unnamed protein product [Albugo candida]